MKTQWWLVFGLWIVIAMYQTYRLEKSREIRRFLVQACTETVSIAEQATEALRECAEMIDMCWCPTRNVMLDSRDDDEIGFE